jgi:hypothetical protein
MNAHDDMSDTDVLTAARDSLSGIPLASAPDVETIMARGRARRHRRLVPGVTGTVAAAAGTAIAVTALVPGGNPADRQPGSRASHQPAIQLTAWTVTKLADGNISITIRELKDPAGLQSTLRADGVPASVTFAGQLNPACRAYPGGTPSALPRPGTTLLDRVFPEPYGRMRSLPLPRVARPVTVRTRRVNLLPRPSANQAVVVIDPSALPAGAGVQLGASAGGNVVLVPQVVYASQSCTG